MALDVDMLILIANTTVLGCPTTLLFKLSAESSSGILQGTIKRLLSYCYFHWQRQSLQVLQYLIEHMHISINAFNYCLGSQ